MQTFLPYRAFSRSAAVLDTARLGKQRVETLQVLRALALPDYGWQRHPVVVMWQGRVPALVAYGLACVEAWTAQGRPDTTAGQIAEFAAEVVGMSQDDLAQAGMLPRWLGNGALHLSHRSALVRKDPAFYRPVFGDVPDDLPYLWPPADPGPDPVTGEGVDVWVVRKQAADGVRVPLRAPSGRRSPKLQRQVDAFLGDMSVGDPVAVPTEDGRVLRVGRVAGDATADGEHAVRPVTWTTTLPRSAVLRPALMQDPCLVFRVAVDAAALASAGLRGSGQDAEPDRLG